MKKYKDIINILLFLVLIFLGGINIFLIDKPYLINLEEIEGIVDFTEKDLEENIYNYKGHWQYYPEKLYTPEDFKSTNLKDIIQYSTISDYEKIQYATYKAQIKLIPGAVYGIYMKTNDYSMIL